MKIFNYSLIAICFSLLFFASCSKTDVTPNINDTELLSSFLSQDVATEKGEVTEEGNFRVKIEETADNKALFDAFRNTGNALELNEDIVLDAETAQAIWGDAVNDSFLENGVTIHKDDIQVNRVTMTQDGEIVDMNDPEIAERIIIIASYSIIVVSGNGSVYTEHCIIVIVINDTASLSSCLSPDVASGKGEMTEGGDFKVKIEETSDNVALFDAFRNTGNTLELTEDIVLDTESIQAIWGNAANDSFLENGITINSGDIEVNRVTMNQEGEIIDMNDPEIAEQSIITGTYLEVIIYEDSSIYVGLVVTII